MAIALAFAAGILLTLIAQLLISIAEPVTTIPEWRALPDRLQTIARWGATKTYHVNRAVPLPIRIPHTTTLPPKAEDHITILTKPWWRRIIGAVTRWRPLASILNYIEYGRMTDELNEPIKEQPWIAMMSSGAHAASEETTTSGTQESWRERVGSATTHSREILEQDPEWRARWAKHPTQEWPTTDTEGHAWSLMASKPIICHSSKPRSVVPSLPLLGSLSSSSSLHASVA